MTEELSMQKIESPVELNEGQNAYEDQNGNTWIVTAIEKRFPESKMCPDFTLRPIRDRKPSSASYPCWKRDGAVFCQGLKDTIKLTFTK